MTLAVDERPHTSATRPFYGPSPRFIAPALLARWYNQRRAIASTSADYEVPLLPTTTQADPVGALAVADRQPRASAIYEIRRLSGLTWDELAEMFGVTRQAANDWANGKAMKPANAHKVQAVLSAFRALPRTSAPQVRIALLATLPSGERPLDLIRTGAIDAAMTGVAGLLTRTTMPLAPREPHRPHAAAYLDRLGDRPIPASGPAAKARTRRARSPKP
jgi:transcriptional regulator with XRE-family HTH domain